MRGWDRICLASLSTVVLVATGCSGVGSSAGGHNPSVNAHGAGVRPPGTAAAAGACSNGSGARSARSATAEAAVASSDPAQSAECAREGRTGGRVGTAGIDVTPAPAQLVGLRLGPVHPPSGPLCSGTGWEQRRGATMLARIRYPYWGLAFSIDFLGARAGFLGYTSYRDRIIEVYVRPCSEESDVVLEHTIAHEIGHAVDDSFSDETRRAQWDRVRGIPAGTPWYGCSTCSDYDTPAGDFAETFAYWQVGPSDYRSLIAPPPAPAQLREVAALFWP